jgi:protein-S-isoprenylcysteine O-methyltransferase Ste14
MSEEERMLTMDDGYRAYLSRVRRRLIPYVY